eukprot:TRINITY_DN10376_c0_g2_i1.p1 TRINITY_DN10376_c0_g2~~TRINITY_DN10376_c0_g2_i1.p1  ORF type:complete len:509 (+),score=177.76 TRINITY_DN10376_c0_g2_i1:97-1527(+)
MLRRSRLLRYSSAPRVTELSNGARVVTYDEFCPVSCVALCTHVGSRYERPDHGTTGCTALLEKLAFRGNRKYDFESMRALLADLGSAVTVSASSRELLLHRAECVRWRVDQALDLLVSMLCLLPVDSPDALEDARQMVREDIVALSRDPSRMFFELVHQAAFEGNTLGNPLMPSAAELAQLTPQRLYQFTHQFVQPERVCVVARGVEHDELCRLAERRLGEAFADWERFPIPDEVRRQSRYTGGQRLVENLTAPPSLAKFQEKSLTHAGLVFEGVPASHRLFFPKAVAQHLLGGGEAFSAGGPGKGLTTKLYRECLCRFRWLHGIDSIGATYGDTGLFGVYGQADHSRAGHLLTVLAHQCATVADRTDGYMLQRAKNRFKSQVFMLVEERGASVEDIGRAVALYDRVWSPEEIKQSVDEVTVADLESAFEHFLSSPPTLAVYGNVTDLPALASLEDYMNGLSPSDRASPIPRGGAL